MRNPLDYLRRFNHYRKTEQFKNKAFKYSVTFLFGYMILQIVFFRKKLDFGKKGMELDEGET